MSPTLSYVSVCYFEYATTSELFVGKPNSLRQLEVSICRDIDQLASQQNVTAQNFGEIVAQLPQFEILGMSHVDGDGCLVDEQQFRQLLADGVVRNFFVDHFVCIRFALPLRTASCNAVNTLGNVWVAAKHDGSGMDLYVSLSAAREYPWALLPRRMFGWFGTQVAQRVITLQLLPYPFHSNCRSNFRYGECLSSCVFIKSGKEYLVDSTSVNKSTSTLLRRNRAPKVIEDCRNECSLPQCYTEEYLLSISRGSGESAVQDAKLETRFVLSPKLTPTEFALYLAGVVGLWLGFAIPSLLILRKLPRLAANLSCRLAPLLNSKRLILRKLVICVVSAASARHDFGFW